MKTVWKGVAASPGIGVGKVFWYRERELRFHARHVADTQMELQRYRQAVDRFCADTEARARLVAATTKKKLFHRINFKNKKARAVALAFL